MFKIPNLPVDISYSLKCDRFLFLTEQEKSGFYLNIENDILKSVTKIPLYEKNYEIPNAIAIPKFVNAHAHLELSGFENPIPWNGSFPDWLRGVMMHRNQSNYSVEAAIARGIHELHGTGTTAIADIVPLSETRPEAIPQNFPGRMFFELICWKPDWVGEFLEAVEKLLPKLTFPGLSPHAPYTVCPELLEGVVNISQKHQLPVAMHLAETRDELELLTTQKGNLLTMMQTIDNGYDPEQSLLGKRPLDYLKVLSRAHQAIIIHGNDLNDEEIDFLAAHKEKMSVVFCPVPHRYFGHSHYPLQKMLDRGITVALGTDSRASWPNGPLSMLETVNVLLQDYPEIDVETALEMATISGHRILDLHQLRKCTNWFVVQQS